MSEMSVGILGVGTYLPEDVRTNDWWPESTVDAWRRSIPELLPKMDAAVRTEGQKAVLAAIRGLGQDPFWGARARRILAKDRMPSEMEIAAAREALASAKVAPSDIDVVLVYSTVPDYLSTPNAAAVHQALGIRRGALSASMDSACNTFHQQLCFAVGLIQSGQARHALLVQSHTLTRLMRPESPGSAWHGDGAAAVVVGPVAGGFGFLAAAHRTDGTFHDAVVSSVPNGRWYDDGPVVWHAKDGQRARSIIIDVNDQGTEVVHEALERASCKREDIAFYASHQATAWFPEVTRSFIGLSKAKTLSTYPWAGSLGAANVPFVLAAASREGVLRSGDLVATYAGGSGLTWSSVVVRWGVG
jgi:3-oxoacyl-[acyl-carrier-protein] synthase III